MLVFCNYCKFFLAKHFRNDSGQTVMEYVMILVLVAVAAFVASPNITDTLVGAFQGTSSMIEGGLSS
jgi:Flp pilus assembly pilin Flp